MILLIDNYDSFVHTLARYFEVLGEETLVARNDALGPEEIEKLPVLAIVLSPGPCTPDEAGISLEVIRRFAGKLPILGVCLGHQAIGAAFGARIVRASPCHGRTARIAHDGRGIFARIPSPFSAARYHSLVIDPRTLPSELEVSATSDDGIVMAVRHRTHHVIGVQFHPESVLTEHGFDLLRNFLSLAERDARCGPAGDSLVPISADAP